METEDLAMHAALKKYNLPSLVEPWLFDFIKRYDRDAEFRGAIERTFGFRLCVGDSSYFSDRGYELMDPWFVPIVVDDYDEVYGLYCHPRSMKHGSIPWAGMHRGDLWLAAPNAPAFLLRTMHLHSLEKEEDRERFATANRLLSAFSVALPEPNDREEESSEMDAVWLPPPLSSGDLEESSRTIGKNPHAEEMLLASLWHYRSMSVFYSNEEVAQRLRGAVKLGIKNLETWYSAQNLKPPSSFYVVEGQ